MWFSSSKMQLKHHLHQFCLQHPSLTIGIRFLQREYLYINKQNSWGKLNVSLRNVHYTLHLSIISPAILPNSLQHYVQQPRRGNNINVQHIFSMDREDAYTMEYYSAIKGTKLGHLQRCGWAQSLSYGLKQRKCCILTHDQILYIIARMWNLEKWYKETYFQAGINKQVYRRDMWTQGRMGRRDKVREQH